MIPPMQHGGVRPLAEHDDREHHADQGIGGTDRGHHGDRSQLERSVVRDVGRRREHRVQRDRAEDGGNRTNRVAAGEHDARRDDRRERLGDDHRPQAADAPADDGAEEVREPPAHGRDEPVDHAGARTSASASTATAPRRPTTSGLASSETSRSRRSWAARPIDATAAATAPRSCSASVEAAALRPAPRRSASGLARRERCRDERRRAGLGERAARPHRHARAEPRIDQRADEHLGRRATICCTSTFGAAAPARRAASAPSAAAASTSAFRRSPRPNAAQPRLVREAPAPAPSPRPRRPIGGRPRPRPAPGSRRPPPSGGGRRRARGSARPAASSSGPSTPRSSRRAPRAGSACGGGSVARRRPRSALQLEQRPDRAGRRAMTLQERQRAANAG